MLHFPASFPSFKGFLFLIFNMHCKGPWPVGVIKKEKRRQKNQTSYVSIGDKMYLSEFIKFSLRPVFLPPVVLRNTFPSLSLKMRSSAKVQAT